MHPTLVASTAIDSAPSSLLSCLTTPPGLDPFACIEAGHHLSASQLFRENLQGFNAAVARESTTFNIDALLTTCMLLNMLSFAGLPEAGPPTSRWPFVVPAPPSPTSSRPLNWLRIQLGFGPLLAGLSTQMREGSQWLTFFMTLGHEHFYDDRGGTIDIPYAFCAFWGIDQSSNADTHPYLKLVRRLLAILNVWQTVEDAGGGPDRHDEQVLRYFQFMQGVDEAFVTKLEARDIKSLVIYGWFMAILASARHWWCRVRAVREAEGVVRWLDVWCCGDHEVSNVAMGNGSAQLRAEVPPWLPFIAKAVGYELKSGADTRQRVSVNVQ
ncbi:uncharacterized protein AB675_9651 [Cyphellophora attinorum]|uniref:Transcription factor domain-containing protein n=1 Tax=Cyphellophora attinorum TaxID=1664694 RepID=A0A0N1HXB2_9EURO|nr:uncharacterized protein AB675_9651 [Phialophora attinorum]KPI42560.1 hypothetical protein AB675_9651 [Phialophora attinorum]